MEELILKDIITLVIRKKWIIILIVLLFALAGVFYTYKMTEPMYKSTTTLVLAKMGEIGEESTSTITQTDITLNSKLVSTYSQLIKSKSVIRETIENLGLANLEENDLRNNIKVNSVSGTEILEIVVSNAKPQYAAAIANEVSIVFTNKVKEIYKINNIYTVDKAEIATYPYNINHKTDIIKFVLLGLMLSGGYILAIYIFDNTIKTEQDIENVVNTLVLGNIPEYKSKAKSGGRY